MNRFYYLVIFLCALCGLFTIAPTRAAASAPVYPNGLKGPSIASGVYPGTDSGNCCWLGPTAAFNVRVPTGADTLLLTIIEPSYAASGQHQSLGVQLDSTAAQERCCLGPGEHELIFTLPHNVPARVLHVRLRAGHTFVPKAIGLNDDPRRLSMLLRSVVFSNSATGEVFGPMQADSVRGGSAVWLALAALVILVLTLRRPVFGAMALVLTDPFLLAQPFHGTTITLPKVALAAVAIGLAFRLRRSLFERDIALWLLLGAQILFILSMGASTFHAVSHGAALRETLKAAQYVATLLVAYLAYRLDPDESAVRMTLSAATVLVAGLAFAQEFVGAPQSEMIAGHAVSRIAGPLEGPNQLAGYLGVMVPAMLAFAVWRPALALERAGIALGCAACVLTFSKAGIGALVVAMVLLLAVRYLPERRAIGAACASIAFAGLFALAAASFAGTLNASAAQIFAFVNSADRYNGGLGVRSDLWHGAYEMLRLHPIAGVGPGNFELEIGRYDPGVRTHANSMYFEVLAEQGIPGFIAMLAVIAASIGVFVRRFDQPLALGACMAAVAMAFHQVLDCMWLYPKVGVMWWLLLAFGAAAVDLSPRTENVAEGAVA